MSEVNQQEANQQDVEKADIDERFEALRKMVEEIDDDYSRLSKQLNDNLLYFQDRIETKIKSEHAEMHKEISAALASIREQFAEKVQERIQAASSDEIAEALTTKLSKLILVTRPATRDEIKTGHRGQASPAELQS
jgi:hypothetical protein